MTTSNPKTIKARNAKRYANDPQYRQAIDAAIEQREQIEKAAKRAKAEQAKQGREWLKAQAAPTVTYGNTVERHAAIENSLSTALHLVRNCKTVSDLQRATARASRAATLLKQTVQETSFNLEG